MGAGKPKTIFLLLTCFVLSTMTVGIVHAQGTCTMTSGSGPHTSICITADKTTYGTGEKVLVQLTINNVDALQYSNQGWAACALGIFETEKLQPNLAYTLDSPYDCGIVVEIVPVQMNPLYHHIAGQAVTASAAVGGRITLQIPDNAASGVYSVGLLSVNATGPVIPLIVAPNGTVIPIFTLAPFVQITVTATPVPEAPSGLWLLLPALLGGFFVLKRRKMDS